MNNNGVDSHGVAEVINSARRLKGFIYGYSKRHRCMLVAIHMPEIGMHKSNVYFFNNNEEMFFPEEVEDFKRRTVKEMRSYKDYLKLRNKGREALSATMN